MSAFYSWHIGTLVDGRITNSLPVSDGSWELVMDDAGTLQATVPLTDPDVAALHLYTSAEPCRCFLAVSYTDPDGAETFLNAGPIWSARYDHQSKLLTLGAAGLWSLWDHRFVLPVLAPTDTPAAYTTTVTASLGTIAKRLIQLAMSHTSGSVPVVFQADEAGTASRTYAGYEMKAVADAMSDLSKSDGGPEIQFVPRRTAADGRYLEWVMRVGTVAQPLLAQTGDDWIWDLTAPKSGASGLSVTRDGSAMADRQWVQGSGTDKSTMFSRADDTTLLGAGFPLLEAVDSSQSTVTSQATLDGFARADLALANRPTEAWTFTADRDSEPRVGSLRPGDWAQLTIAGDPYVPDGDYRRRITNIGGDASTQVRITLKPTLGGV